MSPIFSTARIGLTACLLTGALQAQAYIEKEQSTGASNDSPSMSESVGTLSPGSFLFISGARRTESGVFDNGGGSSADFFRFDVTTPLLATLALETPTAAAMPVLGLFDNAMPKRNLLNSGFDDNSGPSTSLSFAHQLAPGRYYVAVSGFRQSWADFDGGGDSGWTYNLVLSSAAMAPAPVPEPGSMALLLAGLGVLGLVSRRR